MRNVRAALLAGGRGERMGRLTDHVCKPLLPYGGVCRLVDFSVANVVRSGIPEIVVLSRYREGELIKHLFRSWDGSSGLRLNLGPHDALIREQVSVSGGAAQFVLPARPEELGTADALLASAEWVFAPGATDVLLLHADHAYVSDYRHMVREHREAGADVTIGVQRIERRFVPLFGMVEVNRDGAVCQLVEKPSEPTSDLVFTAFCLFRRAVLEEVLTALARLPASEWQHDISRDVLPFIIDHGYRVRAFTVRTYWADIGTVERYYLGHLHLLRSPAALPLLDMPRTLPGSGPMQIGPGQVMSSDPRRRKSRIKEAVLYPGCVVEPAAVIERSIVLPGARVCEGAQVRDTVIVENETVTGVREGLAGLA
jgi:ADP-glucose pyrophosphorylase